MQFLNKVAIVTGASRGIGLACANYFLHQGAKVVYAVRNPDTANLPHQIRASEDVLLIKTDVRQESDIKDMVAETVSRFGRIDILVNNAGVDQPGRIMDVTVAHWNYVMETNVTGLVLQL